MNGCPSREFAQGRDLPSITLLHPIYSRSVQSAEGGKAELESEINRLKLVEADGKTYEGIVESARDAMEKLKRENDQNKNLLESARYQALDQQKAIKVSFFSNF